MVAERGLVVNRSALTRATCCVLRGYCFAMNKVAEVRRRFGRSSGS